MTRHYMTCADTASEPQQFLQDWNMNIIISTTLLLLLPCPSHQYHTTYWQVPVAFSESHNCRPFLRATRSSSEDILLSFSSTTEPLSSRTLTIFLATLSLPSGTSMWDTHSSAACIEPKYQNTEHLILATITRAVYSQNMKLSFTYRPVLAAKLNSFL